MGRAQVKRDCQRVPMRTTSRNGHEMPPWKWGRSTRTGNESPGDLARPINAAISDSSQTMSQAQRS